ncbi:MULTISPECIES: hypothetical protein [unclassified Streptomyces]|uniref:hypothetical protein n=1 Tax=unclassified Streptomyces TaxID=2593676 RepID=UPI0007483CC0|nr:MULTISPECIES: hypothetical protein [unclassified Streptomyces]KUL69495.1 hypothetical protein ADL33_29975 [Streptomyces sp. NRRL WC-3604]KUL75118.1 hypothetical protein ADL34_15630 [Streptomyces sp. NRRL WC-3605]
MDVVIGATATHHGLAVLHDDADYCAIARHAYDLPEHNIHDTTRVPQCCSVTRGAGSRPPLRRWRASSQSPPRHAGARTGADLVPLVRAGARFENGILVEREEQAA